MRKIFTIIFSFIVFPMSLLAQDAIQVVNPFAASYPPSPTGITPCYIDEISHEQFQNDPEYRKRYYERTQEWADYIASDARILPYDSSVRYIPVVFHVVHLPGTPIGTAENIPDYQIESQIRVLNEDFRKIAGTQGDGNGVDTKYEFFLAQVDPAGNCTNGIVRHSSAQSNTTYPGTALKIAVPNWPPTEYFNVWVVNNLGGGIIGWGTWPWELAGNQQLDGVVLRYDVTGDTAEAGVLLPNYNLGATLVHEVGHNFGIFHTFQGGCAGSTAGTCGPAVGSPPIFPALWTGAGDEVCDTPPQASPNSSCASTNSSCGSVDLDEDYMDYSFDPCMNLWTQGQKERMDYYMGQYRSLLIDSANAMSKGFNGCFGITYCQSASSDSSSVQITNVSFETVNNSTGPACTTYADHTDLFDGVIRDSTFNFSVTTGACGGSTPGNHKVVAYFDWNRDADFEDAGEEYLVKGYGPSVGTSIIPIMVPDSAILARTGVRIVCSKDTAVLPCGIYPFGETEDYSIKILPNPPTVIEFYPLSGQSGNTVTIIGEKLNGVTDVKFNGVSAFAFNVVSADTITCLVPSSQTGTIEVFNETGSDVSDSVFTYLVIAPQVTSFSPDSALVGTIIDIYNQGTLGSFAGFTGVEFNGTPAINPVGMTSTWIRAVLPVGATTGKIKVLHPFGDAISTTDFIVMQPLPTANISGTPGTMCQGETTTLTFNLTGTGPFYIEWTDGTTVSNAIGVNSGYQVSYTLSTTTTYSITTLIDSHHSNPNPNASKTITVNNPPIAGFNPTINGLSVTFLNSSSGALDYRWDFGDGTTSIGANPLHTYAMGGTYDACLIAVTNNGCEDTICQTISVTVGLNDQLQDGYFKSFPNPVNDNLNFELELKEIGTANLELISLDGRVVGQKEITVYGSLVEGFLDMKQLSTGTYLLKLTTPDGQQLINKIHKK